MKPGVMEKISPASVWRNILFSIIVVSCVLLALELRQRMRHPQVGFRGMCNSLGFRSPEFDPAKKHGTIRILFLGSSTTFGVTGPVEKTFPFLVGEILREKLPGTEIQTINAAMPAKTSYWEVERMRQTLYLKPDVMVIMTGYNDSASIYGRFMKISEKVDLVVMPWYYRLESFFIHHSVFYVTLREKIAIFLYGNPNFAFGHTGPKEVSEQARKDWFRHYPRHFRNNLEQMIQIASAHQAKVVFIKAPLSAQRRQHHLLYSSAYRRLMKELEGVGVQHHIPTIDLYSPLTESQLKEYIGEDGIHFTDAGNSAIAKAVSDFFVQNRRTYFT